ncbi:MAG: PKD domain-containing protein [Phaeodactylibacter sp.]|uniref:PKD domain-containing protein n=1 Tax=Phaeodactylibacter sp. TaxID=1940289 RepID=UPI0032EC7A37
MNKYISLFVYFFPAILFTQTVEHIEDYVFNNSSSPQPFEYTNFVLPTSDGGYLLVGETQPVTDSGDAIIIKSDASGNEEWRIVEGSNFFDDAFYSAVEVNGHFFVVGSYGGRNGSLISEYWIMKVNTAGNIVINNHELIHGENGVALTVEKTSGGNIIVGGYLTNDPGNDTSTDGYFKVYRSNDLSTYPSVSDPIEGYFLDGKIGKIDAQIGGSGFYFFGVRYFEERPNGDPEYYCIDPNFQEPGQNRSIQPVVNPRGDVVVRKYNAIGNSLVLDFGFRYGGATADSFIDGVATKDGGFAMLCKTECAGFPGDIGYNNICIQPNGDFNPYWILKRGNDFVEWFKRAPYDDGVDGNIATEVYETPFGIIEGCTAGELLVGVNREEFGGLSTYISNETSNTSSTLVTKSNVGTLNAYRYVDIAAGHGNESLLAGSFSPPIFQALMALSRFSPEPECTLPDLTHSGNCNYSLEDGLLKMEVVTIENDGSTSSTNTSLGIFLSTAPDDDNLSYAQNYLGFVSIPGLSPGESFTTSIEVDLCSNNISSGDYSVGLTVDPFQTIEESDDSFDDNTGYCVDLISLDEEDCSPCINPIFSSDCSNLTYKYDGSSYEFICTDPNFASGNEWIRNGTPVSGAINSTQEFSFPTDGNYTICYPYFDSDGCLQYCCEDFCISAPASCEHNIAYTFTTTGYEFTLEDTGQQLTWYTVSSEDNFDESSSANYFLPTQPNCNPLTVCARYYDPVSDCWRTCCRDVTLCDPYECGLIDVGYTQESGYIFSLDFQGATQATWYDDETGQAIGAGAQHTILPQPGECGYRYISVRFWDGIAWRICCYAVYVCDPYECGLIDVGYTQESGYTFSLDSQGATQATWYDDETGQAIGAGAQHTILPQPGECRYRNISVRFWDGNTWRICCRIIYICNPEAPDCFAICDEWIVSELTELSSNFDCDGGLSGCSYKLSSAELNGETVVLIDGICFNDAPFQFHKIYDCSGGIIESCNTIQDDTQTCESGDGTLLESLTNIETVWGCDDGLPDCSFDSVFVSPSNPNSCDDITLTVNGEFPNSCQSILSSSIAFNGNIIEVDIQTQFASGQFCPEVITPWSESLPIGTLPPETYQVLVFRDGVETTSLSIDIEQCCEPPSAGFQYEIQNDTIIFNNGSTGDVVSYFWDFGNGNNSPLENPTFSYASTGNYTVCLTATGGCGEDIYCEDILYQHPDDWVSFKVVPDLCGAAGETVEVPIIVENFEQVTNFQFSLQFENPAIATIEEINFSNAIGGNPISNVLNNGGEGIVIWYSGNAVSLADSTEVIYITVRLESDIEGCSNLLLNGEVAPVYAEAVFGDMSTQINLYLEGEEVCLCSTFSACGVVEREDGLPVENVEVVATDDEGVEFFTLTDALGEYCFPELEAGKEYVIAPQKDINYRNGVNAGDLFRIQRHILLLDQLETPYQIIAANASLPNMINSGDLADIQRLILFLTDHFEDVDSWRFVQSDHTFNNPNNPFETQFPEQRVLTNLSDDITDADFVGIKIGDVNNSADPASIITTENRSLDAPLRIWSDTASVVQGDTVNVELKASGFEQLFALQYSLAWDSSQLELVGVGDDNELLDLSPNNYSITPHRFSMVWFNAQPVTIETDSILLSLKLVAKSPPGENLYVYLDNEPVPAYVEGVQGEMDLVIPDIIINVVQPVRTSNVEKESDYWDIAPNPSNDFFQVINKVGKLPSRVVLHSINGSEVKVWEDCEVGQLFDIQGLSSGMYLVGVYTEQSVVLKRLVIIK